MRIAQKNFRGQAEQSVYAVIETFGPFLTKNKVMALSKVDGTALKRILAALVANGELEVLRTCEFEQGEYQAAEAVVVYATCGAVQTHRLDATVLSDGSFMLTEASSDRVFTMVDSAESRAKTHNTINAVQRGTFRGIATALQACLHPAWRPDFVHSNVVPY
jgi:hypothetical protein